MATLDVYSMQGAKVGTVDVEDAIFKGPVNEALLYQMVNLQRANKRSGTASTKTRADVRGSGKKIYKQKGTGNARHGDAQAPEFVGGGVVFGPHPRDYSQDMPKKARAKALCSALSQRFKENAIMVIDEMALAGETDAAKPCYTKRLSGALKAMEVKSALMVDSDNKVIKMAAHNLPAVKYLDVAGINVYDILKHGKLLLSKAALEKVQERLRS